MDRVCAAMAFFERLAVFHSYVVMGVFFTDLKRLQVIEISGRASLYMNAHRYIEESTSAYATAAVPGT